MERENSKRIITTKVENVRERKSYGRTVRNLLPLKSWLRRDVLDLLRDERGEPCQPRRKNDDEPPNPV